MWEQAKVWSYILKNRIVMHEKGLTKHTILYRKYTTSWKKRQRKERKEGRGRLVSYRAGRLYVEGSRSIPRLFWVEDGQCGDRVYCQDDSQV